MKRVLALSIDSWEREDLGVYGDVNEDGYLDYSEIGAQGCLHYTTCNMIAGRNGVSMACLLPKRPNTKPRHSKPSLLTCHYSASSAATAKIMPEFSNPNAQRPVSNPFLRDTLT